MRADAHTLSRARRCAVVCAEIARSCSHTHTHAHTHIHMYTYFRKQYKKSENTKNHKSLRLHQNKILHNKMQLNRRRLALVWRMRVYVCVCGGGRGGGGVGGECVSPIFMEKCPIFLSHICNTWKHNTAQRRKVAKTIALHPLCRTSPKPKNNNNNENSNISEPKIIITRLYYIYIIYIYIWYIYIYHMYDLFQSITCNIFNVLRIRCIIYFKFNICNKQNTYVVNIT